MKRRPTIELRVERAAHLSREARVATHASLLFPLETSIVTVRVGDTSSHRADRASFVLVPAGARHRLVAEGERAHLATLGITPAAIASVLHEYAGNVDEARFERLLRTPRLLPRTRWVDELVHRYLFERDVCKKEDSLACRFLETELAKEVYFLCAEREEDKTRASVLEEENDVVARARVYIDAHLADRFEVDALAKHCRTSASGILRAFQRELQTTPAAFARTRKLEAALLLLESKKYSVSEVGPKVGYTSLAAFTTAFHKHFGAPPSSVVRAGAKLERLPPHGKPPETSRRKRRKV